MSSKFQEQTRRIQHVFGSRRNLSRRPETLVIYKTWLDKKLDFPVILTGIEDFPWEEFYLFGPGDKEEYRQLLSSRPSYKDKFRMTSIVPKYEKYFGLLARVSRLSDNRRFQIPLADLKTVDRRSAACQILKDYSSWFVNY